MPQLPALLEGTVAGNIAFAARLAGARARHRPARSTSPASIRPSPTRDAAKLSVGEQQRVMLARSLALEPSVLLLDEPTSALDEAARDSVEATLLDLRARLGLSFVLVTHDLAQAEQVGRLVPAARPRVRGRCRLSAIDVSLGDVAGALALVAIAVVVSIWQRADLERDIAVSVARSFVQLTAIGYVIKVIFDQDNLLFVIALIAVMVVFGALTARHRARRVPGAFWPLLGALAVAGASTLLLVVALGIFEPKARFLVPVGGMVVGNAMTAAAVVAEPARRRGARIAGANRSDAGARRDRHSGDAADHPTLTALRNDPPDRLDEDDGADLLPRNDGRDAACGRRADRRRASSAGPPLHAARKRRDRRATEHRARIPELLHPRAPAADELEETTERRWSAAVSALRTSIDPALAGVDRADVLVETAPLELPAPAALPSRVGALLARLLRDLREDDVVRVVALPDPDDPLAFVDLEVERGSKKLSMTITFFTTAFAAAGVSALPRAGAAASAPPSVAATAAAV